MKRSYIAALAVAAIFVLWMLSGQLGDSGDSEPAVSLAAERETRSERQTEEALTRVRVRAMSAEPRQARLVARGRTEANRRVAVRSETSARTVELPTAEGSLVAAGDLLCKLDEGNRAARLEESEAAVRLAEMEYEGARRLDERGLQSATASASASASLATARAQHRQNELDLAYTRIAAPFDGVLERRPVELGDFLQAGGLCGEVIDLDPLLLIGHVAERDIRRLEIGAAASGRLLTGERVSGEIRYLARAADPTTRTFRIEVAVPNPDAELREGITTEIHLPGAIQPAHQVPAAVLALDDAGELGVRIVNSDDRVEFHHVEILQDAPEGLWVTGLPERIRLIVVGQELVLPGEQVEPITTDNNRPAAS